MEEHVLGRAFISGVIVAVIAATLLINMPPSRLKADAYPLVEPLVEAAALGQNWELFAPDPRKGTFRLVARMTYADGVTLEWHQPESDPLVGPYRLYRWQKVADNIIQFREHLRPTMADWLARKYRRDGKRPVSVVLVHQFYLAPAPGSGDMDRPPWTENVLYRAEYPGGGSS